MDGQGILTRDFVAGGFVWTGMDYRGEPTPYSWPDTNSHFGIMDLAGFDKDRTWWYRAWWSVSFSRFSQFIYGAFCEHFSHISPHS